ncbi:ABC transporter ATP-binding protein [Caenispirillum salinarum]|uniref:ABC transporter ATP-binding protein n=1 Tax=Caenispirillum salinarum TaxID=859058 RepID=UPI00384F3553
MTLELRNVSKVVGRETHIRDVSMTLEGGTLNVLLGPTLSGKTSLMRLMAGLDAPTSGQVIMNGTDVTGVPVQKRSVAMVYQQFINYPTLSVWENIASPLKVARRPKAEIEEKVRHAAKLLRIEAMLDRTPLELSGGQQQRTALARALVKGADLVLLDEPLANLDYKLREELREELPRVFAETGAIMVYATTEPTEALLLGGNTATLHEGAVTQFGPTLQVYRKPHDKLTAAVFSDPPMNFIDIEVKGGRAWIGEAVVPATGSLSGLRDGAYTIGFRPNHLYLTREEAGPGAIELEAIVAVTEITGSESFVHADYANCRWVALSHGIHEPEIDTPVRLFLDPDRFFVFERDGSLVAAPETKAKAA